MRSSPSGVFLSLLILSLLTLSSLLPFLPAVSASAGLTFSNTPPRHLIFTPGASYTWRWSILGSDRLETKLSGDLAKYATLDDPAQNTSSRSVSFTLTLPEELPPGQHILLFTVYESAANGGNVGGRAGAAGQITVTSLYPTPYLVASLSIPDIGVGTSATATVALTSWSEVPAPDVYADIVVRDANGTLLLNSSSLPVTVPSRKTEKLTVPLNTRSFSTGRYQATAIIHGVQEGLEATTSFRVGSFDLSLIKSTPHLSAETINRFSFTLGSNWNERIKGVYADVSLEDVREKTATTALEPFGQSTLSAYIDTTSFNLSGNETPFTGKISAHFLDEDGTERTKTFPFNVTVVRATVPETDTSQDESAPHHFSLPINGTMLLYLFLIILVIINLIFLFRRRRDGDEGIKPPGMKR